MEERGRKGRRGNERGSLEREGGSIREEDEGMGMASDIRKKERI